MSGDEGTRLIVHWKLGKDGLTMDRKMIIQDDLYKQPLIRQRALLPGQIESLPCDPESFYRDLNERGLLLERLK